MPTVYNPKMQNVRAAFDNISRQGRTKTYAGSEPSDEGFTNLVGTHVQGVAHYGKYVFLTHNRLFSRPTGWIAVISKETDKVVYWMDTPEEDDNYPHPGGMQVIGDYLMVPVENGSHNHSYIYFYDLSEMTDTVPPRLLSYSLNRHNGTGAAGIANYTRGETEYYLVAAYDNGKLRFYRSNGKTLADPDFELEPYFDGRVSQGGYSSTCLLADKSNGLYMVGFWTRDPEVSPVDYMDLYSINLDKKIIYDMTEPRHMITAYGGVKGIDGVHFRYGAGLSILSDTELKALACQRNFAFGYVTANTFPPK
jgi:hypothetical protein